MVFTHFLSINYEWFFKKDGVMLLLQRPHACAYQKTVCSLFLWQGYLLLLRCKEMLRMRISENRVVFVFVWQGYLLLLRCKEMLRMRIPKNRVVFVWTHPLCLRLFRHICKRFFVLYMIPFYYCDVKGCCVYYFFPVFIYYVYFLCVFSYVYL